MKKNVTLLLIIAALLLSACAQPQVVTVDSGSPSSPAAATLPAVTPTANPGSGQSLSGALTATAAAVTPTAGQTGPKSLTGAIQWDASPQSVVIRVTNCCGFVPPLHKTNYIPEATVWGDGRIVWTQTDENGKRVVSEGQLTQEQMAAILTKADTYGFFGWDELYKEPMSPTDMPSKCVMIKLSDRERRVCEYYKGAPEAFHTLYSTLAKGAGVTGKPYVPAKAYVKTYPVTGERLPADLNKLPVWDAAKLNITLDQFVSGGWMEGPALEVAWNQVNDSSMAILFDGKAYYQISVQVPGLSTEEPPAQ